jgi:hypothetical protein
MTDAPQPTSGSLEARIIRACTIHRTCPLTCKQRRVEELGTIARFAAHHEEFDPVPPSILQRLKEGLSAWLR